jgi:hypothetical protein
MTGPRLLIVHHTPSPAVRALLEAARQSLSIPELQTVEVHAEPALSATASDVLAADAVLLLTPANIGYMSGAAKHFFDTIYYPCMDATRALPWGLVVHGNDCSGGRWPSPSASSGRRPPPTSKRWAGWRPPWPRSYSDCEPSPSRL